MVDHEVALKKTWFIQSKEGRLEDYYDVNQHKDVIGSGAFASVIKATSLDTHQFRAVKILRKEKITDKEKFKAEIEILKRLDHPNVLKLFETFEDKRCVYLVTELCKGGEVFDRIIKKGKFTESEARKVFRDMVHAINYCHSNTICHRDLKPENFLYLDVTEESRIKLIDFGLAREFKNTGSKTVMTSRVGTSYYIAPEVLAGAYDESCDLWSLGVILYIMLSGYPPFNGSTDAKIIEKVKKCAYNFDSAEWKNVSESAISLIKQLLCLPESRLKASEVLQHPWMLLEASENEQPLNLNYELLQNFTNAQRLKKAALTVIASKMSEDEIQELSAQFTRLDKDGNGVLTLEEMEAGLHEMKDKFGGEILKLFESIDTDKSGTINYTEFVAAAMEKNTYLKEDKLLDAFKVFDKDGNGKISAAELREIMGSDPSYKKNIEYFEEMIKEADLNGDGEIDYEEFVSLMHKTQ